MGLEELTLPLGQDAMDGADEVVGALGLNDLAVALTSATLTCSFAVLGQVVVGGFLVGSVVGVVGHVPSSDLLKVVGTNMYIIPLMLINVNVASHKPGIWYNNRDECTRYP